MKKCDVCGNEYDKCFTVTFENKSHTFDCFECAIHALAPSCAHCNCKILGHGMEKDKQFYCCAHCAKESGVKEFRDRA